MKGYENLIFKEDGTLTQDAAASTSKNTKKLINAFTKSHKHSGKEDYYYVQVAKDWLAGYEKRFHRISIACISLFLLLWLGPHAFGIIHISGIWAILYFIGLFFSPILGLLISLYGKGWKRWLLALVNVMLIIIFIIIMV
ncbi:hypothetical protein [Oceanobacillus kapialis]|uniref:hypothetical protein n=1 Tax=Oceanobacillus kapialis TaxID=481353 RepID=UPI00384F2AA1